MAATALLSTGDVHYGPSDVLFAGDAAQMVGITGAHALFCVEISRHDLRPHAVAICDAKEPEAGDVQLLLALMHVAYNTSLCDVGGSSSDVGGGGGDEGGGRVSSHDASAAYFDHEMLGRRRRIDVWYEHVIDGDQPYAKAIRFTFAVNDPTCDMAVGLTEVMRLNREEARARERAAKSRRKGADDDAERPPPWKAYTQFTSVHDIAQAVDVQLKRGARCIDNEEMLLGTPLHDRNNPANVQQALGYARRAGELHMRGTYTQCPATGKHTLTWRHPYNRNVVHLPHKFTEPEVFFALPFASVWLDQARVQADGHERLAATTRLRMRTEWQWKEYCDTEHLQRETAAYVKDKPLTEALRQHCEKKFWEVISSRASRLPLVAKIIMEGAIADGDCCSDPIPTHLGTGAEAVPLTGLDEFGRWLVGKFEDINASGGVVAHLREFMRIDLVGFASLRRARNVLAPFIISRGIRGSGKSMQREACLKRHRNGKRCGYLSAKSRFIDDRDKQNEIYFPLDGFWESYDEAPAHLGNERSGLRGEEKQENSIEKEMISSGMINWECLSSWGAGVKRKTSRGTVSCYIGRTVNSNSQINFTDSP